MVRELPKKIPKSDGENARNLRKQRPTNTQQMSKQVTQKPPQNDVFFVRPPNCENAVPEQVLCLTTKFIPLHDDR